MRTSTAPTGPRSRIGSGRAEPNGAYGPAMPIQEIYLVRHGETLCFLLDTATLSILSSYRGIAAVKRWNAVRVH